MSDILTERQQREIEYHRGHAEKVAPRPLRFDIIASPERRWWNAYWATWDFLMSLDLSGKTVLVIGCGSGQEAIYFAKLGAKVSAFDLSPEMLAHAVVSARNAGVPVVFERMPAERLTYPARQFDLIYAQDILHHVEIPEALAEIRRVAKPGALLVINEIYSHSWTERIRRNRFVERFLYPAMQRFVYQSDKPYITEDERKLTERDLDAITGALSEIRWRAYFNFAVNRLIPDKFVLANKVDRHVIRTAGSAGRFLGGRVTMAGEIRL